MRAVSFFDWLHFMERETMHFMKHQIMSSRNRAYIIVALVQTHAISICGARTLQPGVVDSDSDCEKIEETTEKGED
jgi:hypothetical protein